MLNFFGPAVLHRAAVISGRDSARPLTRISALAAGLEE
jgi:hypothetical protein